MKKLIIRFNRVKTPVDTQIDSIQDRAIKELDLAVRTLELNDCKPQLVYYHTMNARYELKNLVSDLKLDTRL